MLDLHKWFPMLSEEVLKQDSKIAYCYQGIRDMFVVNNLVSPPYLVTGNKMRFKKVGDLLGFLFH